MSFWISEGCSTPRIVTSSAGKRRERRASHRLQLPKPASLDDQTNQANVKQKWDTVI